MGNKNSTPQRRNTDNPEQQLQYRTNHGAVPVTTVPQSLENAPPPGTRTRSNFPHRYRNEEGEIGHTTQTFEDYTTGPNRANGPAGQLHEYPVPTPGEQFHFRYEDRTINARQANRPIHPNERANVMGPFEGQPRNDPKQTRGIVRVAQIDGKPQNVVVGVVDHPRGQHQALQRAPFEPLSREGRQAADRHTDEKGRSRTYPPRGLDAQFVEGVETKYQKVNPPAHPQMRR